MSQANTDSFEKKVKKAIEASGLPTEIMATKALVNSGWQVQNEFPYVDGESKKIRTLDIKAEASFDRDQNNEPTLDYDSSDRAILCELFIECKKSNKPWVFYLDKLTCAEINFRIDRLSEDLTTKVFNSTIEACKKSTKNPEAIEQGKIPESILSNIPTNFDNLQYEIALSHQIVFTNQFEASNKMDDVRDEIYNAEMQLFKALNYQERQDRRIDFTRSAKRAIIPIILLNGDMFGCYYNKQELQTSKIKYTRHLAHGLPNQKIPALIDVVTLDYFEEYINKIVQFFFSKV